MSGRALRALPAVAVATALLGAGSGILLREPAYGLVRVTGAAGLSVTGDQGRAAPSFDIRDMAPEQGQSKTFVVVRQGRPLPATLLLAATDLVDDEGACPEPEGECSAPGELSSQLLARVQHAPHSEATGCGARSDAGEVTLRRLSREPLLVTAFRGTVPTERICVVVTLSLPDQRDNNVVQGDRSAFGLRFTASSSGGVA